MEPTLLLDPAAELALLSQIMAAPDDDVPKLVYADWLEENGLPNRAKYLRKRCELPHDFDDSFDVRRERCERLAEFEVGIRPGWLAMVDTGDKFTYLWPLTDLQQRLRRDQLVLDFAPSRQNGNTDFWTNKVKPGDYLYPLTAHRKQLLIIGRMRVVDLTERWPQQGAAGALGEQGTEVRDDIIMPGKILERLTYRNRTGERGVRYIVNGELTRSGSVQGVYRLARQSALDIDCLIAGIDPMLF